MTLLQTASVLIRIMVISVVVFLKKIFSLQWFLLIILECFFVGVLKNDDRKRYKNTIEREKGMIERNGRVKTGEVRGISGRR